MDELKIAFNNYINEFTKLTLYDKRNEVLMSIKELIAIFDKLAKIDNINLQYLSNKEINDVKDMDVSEDDFLEACIVYIEIAKNIIGQYLDAKKL